MRSELGQRLRNNSNLLSRDAVPLTAMSHQDAGGIHTQIHTEKKIISCTYELTVCEEYACVWTLLQS